MKGFGRGTGINSSFNFVVEVRYKRTVSMETSKSVPYVYVLM